MAARFPDTEDGLRALPGIGGYTAAAIAAIAFDRPAAVVDGNVERVVTRLYAIETPLPAAKPKSATSSPRLLPADRPGDFAAGDDGSRRHDLHAAPAGLHALPAERRLPAPACGDPERFPVKAPKTERPQRVGAAFVAVRGDGAVLLRKRARAACSAAWPKCRPPTGRRGRDGWRPPTPRHFAADWRFAGRIVHVFTHFALDLAVFRADVGERPAPPGHWWSAPPAIHGEALPTVMKKAIEAAIPGATQKRTRPRGRH